MSVNRSQCLFPNCSCDECCMHEFRVACTCDSESCGNYITLHSDIANSSKSNLFSKPTPSPLPQ